MRTASPCPTHGSGCGTSGRATSSRTHRQTARESSDSLPILRRRTSWGLVDSDGRIVTVSDVVTLHKGEVSGTVLGGGLTVLVCTVFRHHGRRAGRGTLREPWHYDDSGRAASQSREVWSTAGRTVRGPPAADIEIGQWLPASIRRPPFPASICVCEGAVPVDSDTHLLDRLNAVYKYRYIVITVFLLVMLSAVVAYTDDAEMIARRQAC